MKVWVLFLFIVPGLGDAGDRAYGEKYRKED